MVTSSVVGVQMSSEFPLFIFLDFSDLGDENSCRIFIAESDLEMPDFRGSSPLCLFVCIVPFSTPRINSIFILKNICFTNCNLDVKDKKMFIKFFKISQQRCGIITIQSTKHYAATDYCRIRIRQS